MLNDYWSRLFISFVTVRVKQNIIAFNVINNNDSIQSFIMQYDSK